MVTQVVTKGTRNMPSIWLNEGEDDDDDDDDDY
jgi:hypothetical protein